MHAIPRQIIVETTSIETEMDTVQSGQYYQNQMPDSNVLQEVAQNGNRRVFDQTLAAGLYGYLAGTGMAATTSPFSDKLAVTAGVTVSVLSLVGLLGTTYSGARDLAGNGYKLLVKNLLVAGVVGLLGYSAATHKNC